MTNRARDYDHHHRHGEDHGHGHDHVHDHGDEHGHHHGHDHGHDGGEGALGRLKEIFVPNSHDSADKVDSALEARQEGVLCLKISFAGLILTALVQTVIV